MTSKVSEPVQIKQLLNKGFLRLTLESRLFDYQSQSFCIGSNTRCQILDNGVILFEPLNTVFHAMDIVLTCGVHGNETGPIELIDSLVDNLLMAKTPINNRVLCIIGNPLAVAHQQRFLDENLNRLFNGEHKGKDSYESTRAHSLEYWLDYFFNQSHRHKSKLLKKRVHYDLHTAIRKSRYDQFVVYPYPDDRGFNKEALGFFQQCGINTALLANSPNGTFSYHSSHHYQADSFTVELGRVKPFGQNNWRDLKPIYQALLNLISGHQGYDCGISRANANIYAVKHELIKQSDSFRFNLEGNIENFYEIPVGYQLTHDIQGGYQVTEQGEAIVFPNPEVPINQRAGLVVKKLEIVEVNSHE